MEDGHVLWKVLQFGVEGYKWKWRMVKSWGGYYSLGLKVIGGNGGWSCLGEGITVWGCRL